MSNRTTLLATCSTALLLAPHAARAGTPPPCSSLPGTVLYLESGDTQEELLKVLGRKLRDQANITLAFTLTGSCGIVSDLYTGSPLTGGIALNYIPSTAEDPSWDPLQPELLCTVDPSGVPVDLGIAALFAESCGLGGPPPGAGLSAVKGPIQAYTFIVPTASAASAIWAEEAYYAFGFGNANALLPWNHQELMFIRPPSKSTLVATALNIGVPPNKWHGVPESASTDVLAAVASSPKPDPTIGIMGSEVYDANRGAGVKTLAFRAFGQQHAYFPDSQATAFDKQNVRDGHYTLWSPTIYLTPVTSDGTPRSAAVAYLEELVLGVEGAQAPDGGASFDALPDVVGVGLVPDCAMQVTRTVEGGPLSLYDPPEPCRCAFLHAIPGATDAPPEGCTACTSDTACGTGKCRHGFCEVR